MTCHDRDSDLLLLGLGELSFWPRLRIVRHLRSCPRCRARQAELTAVSGHIAGALRPPQGNGNIGRGPGAPIPIHPGLPGVSTLFLVLVLGVLTMTAVTIWYVRSHTAIHRSLQDDGCRPDLPNDLCR
jgi:anti-sigma factor RsiW